MPSQSSAKLTLCRGNLSLVSRCVILRGKRNPEIYPICKCFSKYLMTNYYLIVLVYHLEFVFLYHNKALVFFFTVYSLINICLKHKSVNILIICWIYADSFVFCFVLEATYSKSLKAAKPYVSQDIKSHKYVLKWFLMISVGRILRIVICKVALVNCGPDLWRFSVTD